MGDSGGHWKTLAEAQKLTQSMKIPGVFEEDIKRNNPIDRIPVAQGRGTGLKIEWLREKVTTENDVVETGIGDQLSWTESMEYTEKEATLRRLYIQKKLDHYVEGIYGTYNNYEAQMLLECEKGLRRKLGARLIYADYTYGGSPAQFDGFHALNAELGTPNAAATTTYSDLNIDMATGALSLALLRRLVDAAKHGIDELLMPFEIVRNMDAAYQEKGFVGLATGTAGNLSYMTMGFNEAGKRVLFWDAIPIIRSDFMVAENDGTGTGATSDARQVYTTGTKCYSIFALKYGSSDLGSMDPGICFVYGGTQGQGDLYKLVRFPELEDYDAGGIRIVTYGAVVLKSSLCLGRIFDITDAAIVV